MTLLSLYVTKLSNILENHTKEARLTCEQLS